MVEGTEVLKQFRVPHCTFGARDMLEVQGTLEVHLRGTCLMIILMLLPVVSWYGPKDSKGLKCNNNKN